MISQPANTSCDGGSQPGRDTQIEEQRATEMVGIATQPEIVQNVVHAFAHPSEQEVARLLDFYQMQYEYEPRSFPLAWTDDGRVTLSFTPDFYLPELDLYVELTTLKQSLVTKKNRKLRRLRELYPDINIKLFYLRDFRNLMAKYGLPSAHGPLGVPEAASNDEAGHSHDLN